MHMKLFKFLELPGPRELGWSDHDCLGLRDFTPYQEGKTWEDWTAYVKEHYPVRYFLVETIPDWFRPTKMMVKDAWYWVKCHTLPSHRFHLLDFRGVDPLHEYTHGYMDPCSIMKLAGWAALRIYIEKEEPWDPSERYTAEELEAQGLTHQKADYDEAMALYHWWMVERGEEEAERMRLYRVMKDTPHTNVEEYRAAKEPWHTAYDAHEAKEEEMFLRLVKLRPRLWT
jgi:hypothetical protein